MPSRAPAGPPRRTVLNRVAVLCTAGSAAALLSACSDEGSSAAQRRGEAAARALRTRSARESLTLLERYDATLDAHPALAGRLRPLRDEVARHAKAFGNSRGPASPSVPSSVSPGSTARAAGPEAPEIPGDEKKAVAELAGAERRLADTRSAALLDAPPEVARVLASVAAAGAAHAYLLTEGS
ncbi:hypothetical protein [Streptomyces meridianus]